MRSYPKNSPRAAGRLLALTMIVDGNVALSELNGDGVAALSGRVRA